MGLAPPPQFHASLSTRSTPGSCRACFGRDLSFLSRAQGPSPEGRPNGFASAPAFLIRPRNVKAEGLPPFPHRSSRTLAPYASSRRAILLGLAPARSRVLITTAFGTVTQIHSVAGPGMDRQQLTFFREGINRGGRAPGMRPTVRLCLQQGFGRRRRNAPAASLRSSDRNRGAPDRRKVPERLTGLVAPFWSDRI